MSEWRIETGDALKLFSTLDKGSVRLVVTSPPYPGRKGNRMSVDEYLCWTMRWTHLVEPYLCYGAVVALNVHFGRTEEGWFDKRLFEIAQWLPESWRMLDVYVYGKANPPPAGPLIYCDPPGWELVFVLTNAETPRHVAFEPVRRPYAAKSVRRDGSGLLYSNMSQQELLPHPDGARQSTLLVMSKSADQNRPHARGISFPRQLPERFIRQYSRPGELVLDPFCGAGTTGWVARTLGRRFVGFEIDPAEAQKAREWIGEVGDGSSY